MTQIFLFAKTCQAILPRICDRFVKISNKRENKSVGLVKNGDGDYNGPIRARIQGRICLAPGGLPERRAAGPYVKGRRVLYEK